MNRSTYFRITLYVLALFFLGFRYAENPAKSVAQKKADVFIDVRLSAQNKNWPKAILELEKISDKNLTKDEVQIKKFGLGVFLYEDSQFEKSKKLFKSLSAEKSDWEMNPYVYFYLGLNEKNQKNLSKAESFFKKAQKYPLSIDAKNQLEFERSLVDIEKKRWRSATKKLRRLQRKWRWSQKHPEVLWNLARAERRKSHKRSCYWAKKLYSNYPNHVLAKTLNYQKGKVNVGEKNIKCELSRRDIKRRISKLQFLEEKSQALNEINSIIKKDKVWGRFLLGKYWVKAREPKKAIDIFLKDYEFQQKNSEYLFWLGKAFARTSQTESAVKEFMKVSQLSSRRQLGRWSFFLAGYLNYQEAKYSRSKDIFQKFVKKHKKTKLAKEAQWYLAWVTYLEKDYDKAQSLFKNLLKESENKHSYIDEFDRIKFQYWLGMTYFKKNQLEASKKIFYSLIEEDPYHYYGQRAYIRLVNWPEIRDRPVHLFKKDRFNKFSKAERKSRLKKFRKSQNLLEEYSIDDEDLTDEDLEEETFLERKLAQLEDFECSDCVNPSDKSKDFYQNEKNYVIDYASVDDELLKLGFLRAETFLRLGLKESALKEFAYVERKTNQENHLLFLMMKYKKIGAIERSTYIGHARFLDTRNYYGLQKANFLWRRAYPRAYKGIVHKEAQRFGVSPNLIWSVMKAESRYQKEVVSFAGAVGLMQLMPSTAQKVAQGLKDFYFNPNQLKRPKVNILLGSKYLKRLLKKFNHSMVLTVSAYNAGPHRVTKWLGHFGQLDVDEFIEHIPFGETRNYVKKVMRYYAIYSDLYKEAYIYPNQIDHKISSVVKEDHVVEEKW